MSLSARVAGEEARRGGSSVDAQDPRDLSPYAFRILNRLARAEADHAPTRLFHDIRSPRIGFTLGRVMLAVDLDDELACDAGEVSEKRPDGMLTPELQPAHAVRAQ